MPPLGLAYIAAAIRDQGHEVCVVDAPGSAPRNYYLINNRVRVRGLAQEEIIERIPSDARVIGLGCMFTSHWVFIRDLIYKIRESFPSAFIVMGGEHATGFPHFLIRFLHLVDN